VQLGVNKPTVDTVAAQLQSDSRALRHDLKLHGDFRRKALGPWEMLRLDKYSLGKVYSYYLLACRKALGIISWGGYGALLCAVTGPKPIPLDCRLDVAFGMVSWYNFTSEKGFLGFTRIKVD